MSGVQQPRPEPHGGRRQPDLVPLLIERWAQLAMQRPWRYLATWAVGIGVVNLGLRMLLNDLSLAHNARLAILTAVGFSMFAWLYTAQLTRPLRRRRPNLGLTRPSPSRAAQPTGAPSRRAARCRPALAHGQGPSGHVHDVGRRSPGEAGGQASIPIQAAEMALGPHRGRRYNRCARLGSWRRRSPRSCTSWRSRCGRPKPEELKGTSGAFTAPLAPACPAASCASAAGHQPPERAPPHSWNSRVTSRTASTTGHG
jgi:hypothetical protein